MIYLLKKIKKRTVLLTASIYTLLAVGLGYAENGNGNNGEESLYENLPNPLRFESIQKFLTEITNFLIWAGLILIPLMIIIGGAFYMFGGAKPEYVEKGKNIIKWTVVGVFVIVAARAILWLISYVFS